MARLNGKDDLVEFLRRAAVELSAVARTAPEIAAELLRMAQELEADAAEIAQSATE